MYLNAQMDVHKNKSWENPFSEGGYEINSDDPVVDATPLFKVKGNRIEVLYDWPGGKAPLLLLKLKKKYSHFNFEFEYKWGVRKFPPREMKNVMQDFCFMYMEKIVWPSSLECQVQEGDTGDLWVIKGPKVTVIKSDGTKKNLDASGEEEYQRNIKEGALEKDGWNHVRIEVRGSQGLVFLSMDNW